MNMKGKKYVKKNYVSGCQAQPRLIRNFNSKRTFSQIEKSSLDFDKILLCIFSRHLEINQISSNAKVAQIFPPWDTFHTYNEHDLESFFGWFSWQLKIKNHVSFWPEHLSVWSDDNTNHWRLSQHARITRSGTPAGSRDLEPRNI